MPIRPYIATLAVLGAAAATSSCTGGCYNHAAPVSVVPATPCLTLFGGQSATDDTVCAVPQLGGQNDCTDTLTLPPPPAGGQPITVAAGARIAYPIPDKSGPGVTVTSSGGTTTYMLSAMLGATSLAIIVTVH